MNTIWNFLNGKKTIIASLAGVLLSWAQAQGFVSGDTATLLASALTLLTGGALAHKAVKAKGGA
jgi:hypothetical protein